MEDWQQWQARADQIAASLNEEVSSLEQDFFSESADGNLRPFWPRFRQLKERVRTAPAIRLEAKLALERRLRGLGARAYKSQEATYARSGERKEELLTAIAELRGQAEGGATARDLRNLRRELDRVREQFDAGSPLVSADRQAVWDAWREASQFVWKRLTEIWTGNEEVLRGILVDARGQLDNRNPSGARGGVGKFFEALKAHEAKQDAVVQMKREADGIRREADDIEERRAAERAASQTLPSVPALDSWRWELERNREAISRLAGDVAELEKQYQESTSILEQAMVRGNLVEKKRKLTEYERSTRNLEQRIEQTEEAPVMTTG